MTKTLLFTAFLLVFTAQAASQPVSVGEAADKASESVVVLPDRGIEEQKNIARNLASGIGAEYVSDQDLREDTKTNSNLVIVGGPRINQITSQIKTGNDLLGEPPQRGESKIQVLEGTFSEDKSVTVISGYTTQGITAAANRFERISSGDYEGTAQEQVLKFDVASYQESKDSSDNSNSAQDRSAQKDEQENTTEQKPEKVNTSSLEPKQEGSGTDRGKQSGESLINQILRLLGI